MIRRLVGSLALALVLVSGAKAQTLNDPGFQAVRDRGNGIFSGSVNGLEAETSIPAQSFDPYAPFTVFKVWCVDEVGQVVFTPTTYPVIMTSLASSTLGASYLHDRNSVTHPGTDAVAAGDAAHAASYNDYAEAAWLTTQMTNSGTGSGSGPNDFGADAGNTALECAIWSVMGFQYAAGSGGSGHEPACFDAGGNILASVTTDINASLAGASTIILSQWMIITDNSGTCGSTYSASCHQEFLARAALTPEPATMTMLAMGLVGMAGAGMRRRKNKK